MTKLILAAALVLLLISGVAADPSFLGTTGLILTPDDKVLDNGDFSACYRTFKLDNTVNVIGANIGAANNLEIGVARFDADVVGADQETYINGKYLLVPESATSPAVVAGVLDAGGVLDPKGDPSLYLVIGKNLTPAATDMAGSPMRPVRGYIGAGSGIYNGAFAGLVWAFSDRASLALEYLAEIDLENSISETSVFNGSLRFQLTDTLRGDVVLMDAKDLAFGVTYNKVAF
ncbi:MAG: hypothetical protein ACYC2Y_01785 [Armatimonadota bacterium]